MTDPNRIAAIDAARSVYLGGWAAAVCVNPDFEESYWLLSPAPNPDKDHGCACPDCAPHDQLTPTTRTRSSSGST